ncbi:MAG: bacillithiol system redox-active protein YtxJ [Bacteroidota bacterium]
MNWNKLEDISDIDKINNLSKEHKVLLFKHSTRCSISSSALNRLERNWKDEDSEKLSPYYLDLLKHRNVSNAIAEFYAVEHQSPQVLVIKDGKCIYTETHYGISYEDLTSI